MWGYVGTEHDRHEADTSNTQVTSIHIYPFQDLTVLHSFIFTARKLSKIRNASNVIFNICPPQ